MADQPRLFDPGPEQRPDRDYDPNEWSKAPDVVWHGSHSSTPPKPEQDPGNKRAFIGLHVGTLKAATERTHDVNMWEGEKRENIYPYSLGGQFAIPPEGHSQAEEYSKWAWKDTTEAGKALKGRRYASAWSDSTAQGTTASIDELNAGRNLAYVNEAEDKGSMSFVTKRPESLSTWSESTLADKNAPSHLRALAEHYELVGKRTHAYNFGYPLQQWMQNPLPEMGGPEHSTVGAVWASHPEGTIGEHAEAASHEPFGRIANVLKRKY